MAFFKFRKGEGDSVAAPAQPESVEAMRRRARQRLIGAAILVLAGVIGFPLLFDTQPRPVSLDIPIEIPDRNRVAPITVPPAAAPAPAPAPAAPPLPAAAAAPAAAAPAAPPSAPVSAPVSARAEPSPAPRPEPQAKSPEKPEPPPQVHAEPKPEPKPQPSALPAKHPPSDDGARARALLEGRAPAAAAAAEPAAPAAGRYVVQVGAFAEAAKAREVRQRLERAGIKTYVQVARTADGPRIRVRVGPFGSRAEVDKVAQKIKGLDLPAAVLTL